MREMIKKTIKKLTARKFLAMIAGVAVGLCLIFGVEGGEVTRVSGAVTSFASLLSYILTEGKLDLAAIRRTEEDEKKTEE